MKKHISILGSTGSIGQSCLDVCRQHPDRFVIDGLAAGRNIELLTKQAHEFQPKVVSVSSEEDYKNIKDQLPKGTEVTFGKEGSCQVASLSSVDTVVSAIVGAAGLLPTIAAIKAGKTIALANKESMIVAGELISSLVQEHNTEILPVDSEHSAIFQCLNGEHPDDILRLILTASGGPFLQKPLEEFPHITKEQALKHPNWDMGAKITIDSATMMNKGLEVIEAHYLFNQPIEKIDVNVHPQSIIHSMIEFVDGSVMAQLGEPDMKVPIAYALSYPRRISTGTKTLSLPQKEKLTFFAPDFEKFPCLKLAFDVAKKGQSYVPVLNAANEVAVDRFLNDQIHFNDIPKIIDKTLSQHNCFDLKELEDILEADSWARNKAQENIKSKLIA